MKGRLSAGHEHLPARRAEPGKWDGKQYLLPKDFSPLAVYYNKKLFDAAGVAYPKDGWTWDEFLDTAQKLTKTRAPTARPSLGRATAGLLDHRL